MQPNKRCLTRLARLCDVVPLEHRGEPEWQALAALPPHLQAERQRREAAKKRKEEAQRKAEQATAQKISNPATLKKMLKSKKLRKSLRTTAE